MPGSDEVTDDLLDPLQVRGFGDYELREEIARGGMGVVYRAWQISLRREVAVKMILAGELAGPDALRMFQNEAHAAANLHHPNIVPVFEIGEYETQHYFTMRFVPGGQTIADWAGGRRGNHRLIAGAVARVARAVAHAHERGVLHRDLKPSNILWDPSGEPQVTDFGLAKVLASDGMATLSAQALGSPSYMAPEQMGGRTAEITTATDVYGLGAVLYEVLSGQPPFSGASALDTMRRAADEAPPPLTGVPKDLRTICEKCLEKTPGDRYASAADLATDLEHFVRGEPVSAVPLALPQVWLRWAARKPRVAALLGLFVASLIVGVASVTWQWRRTESARAAQAMTLEHLDWQEMTRWARTGEEPRAIAYLASLLRARPDHWRSAMYAMSIVDQRSFAILAGPPIYPPVPVVLAAVAPDGEWLAAAGTDARVRAWDATTGRQIAEFATASPISALAVAAGPITLAVATENGGLSMTPDLTIPPRGVAGLEAPIVALQFSADGTKLLARSTQRLAIWSTSSIDQPPLTLALNAGIGGAQISANGARVFAWTLHQAVVWDTGTGAELLRVPATTSISRGALAAGGERVAFIDGAHIARVFDVGSGRSFPAIENALGPIGWIALDRAGDRVTITADNNLMIHDSVSGLVVSPVMQHRYQVDGLAATSDGASLVSVGWDGAIHVWDARQGQSRIRPVEVGGSTEVAATSASRDGSRLLIHLRQRLDRPESLAVWRGTHTREPQRRVLPGQRDFDAGRMSPDGRLGALGLLPSNRSYIYELDSGRVVLDRALAGRVYVHLFSPDMQKVYVATRNGWLYGFSLETGQPLWPPNQQPGLVRPAEISPDGRRIVVGHNDGHIRTYDTATGLLVQTLDHPGEIKLLRFAPDGSGRFVSASTDRLAHVWDVATGKKLQTFVGHTDAILAGAWSPDSRSIATASYDKTARVWDVVTGQAIGQPLQHLNWLAHLEFSPDGQLLATASRDGTARLWNPRTSQPASPLMQGSTGETVRFTADGKALLVRDQDGFAFWDVQTAEPASVYYSEPNGGGLGMDAENYRSIMSADGRRVFLGCAMNYGALWTVPQPRGQVPAWFPDFLTALAGLQMDPSGEARTLPASELARLLPAIQQSGSANEYAIWAARVISSAPSQK